MGRPTLIGGGRPEQMVASGFGSELVLDADFRGLPGGPVAADGTFEAGGVEWVCRKSHPSLELLREAGGLRYNHTSINGTMFITAKIDQFDANQYANRHRPYLVQAELSGVSLETNGSAFFVGWIGDAPDASWPGTKTYAHGGIRRIGANYGLSTFVKPLSIGEDGTDQILPGTYAGDATVGSYLSQPLSAVSYYRSGHVEPPAEPLDVLAEAANMHKTRSPRGIATNADGSFPIEIGRAHV